MLQSIQRIWLIAQLFFRQKFVSWRMLLILLGFGCVIASTSHTRLSSYRQQQVLRQLSQEADRQSWERNPDKHPHRMAHFGAFAFREQHALSAFDTGLESYMGNVVYLEAHKQNTANFSEASLSTGLLRFGELNVAMLCCLVLPLFLFFVGHDALTQDRALSTLRLMYIQGAELREILLGKTLGLFAGAVLFALPALAALWWIALTELQPGQELLMRSTLLTLVYLAFLLLICLWTVFVSGWSRSSSQSLLILLGLWLVCFIVLPKSAQAIGAALHPAPSKLVFKKLIEEEVLAFGDPHNTKDPHFDQLRDSLLRQYGVSDITDLPFNYGGYLAALGERHSSGVYARQQQALMQTYRQQAGLSRSLALLDPYLAVKELSMALTGTDFDTYDHYLLQAERYRFALASYMAELQTKYIDPKHTGGTEGKRNTVQREEFLRFPPFVYQYHPLSDTLRAQRLPLVALLSLLGLSMALALAPTKAFRIR